MIVCCLLDLVVDLFIGIVKEMAASAKQRVDFNTMACCFDAVTATIVPSMAN
jgi:hypothetical protein